MKIIKKYFLLSLRGAKRRGNPEVKEVMYDKKKWVWQSIKIRQILN